MILSRIEKNANYCWSKLDAMISQKETELRHHLCVEGCKGYDNVYCSLNHNKKKITRDRGTGTISATCGHLIRSMLTEKKGENGRRLTTNLCTHSTLYTINGSEHQNTIQ